MAFITGSDSVKLFLTHSPELQVTVLPEMKLWSEKEPAQYKHLLVMLRPIVSNTRLFCFKEEVLVGFIIHVDFMGIEVNRLT